MGLQYQRKEGNYLLYDLDAPASTLTGAYRLRLRTDAVAIAFDRSTGMLHEHGNPLRIQSWASNTRRHLRAAGAWDRAEDIVVVAGSLPVDEINKCLAIKGYCRSMLHRLPPGPKAN
jgi:hypothetical protein